MRAPQAVLDLFRNSLLREDLKETRNFDPQRTLVREDSSTGSTRKSSAEASFERGLIEFIISL